MATNWLDSIPLEKQEWAIRLTAHLTQLGAIEAGYDPKQLVVDELFEPAGEIARFLFLRRIKQAVDVWNTSWDELCWRPDDQQILTKWIELGIDPREIQHLAQVIALTTTQSILSVIDTGHDPDASFPETDQPIASWDLTDEDGNYLTDLHHGLW
ncbi:MAG TPA: hypothetical protein PLL06_08060 [Acidobacteriota bacterium]|nr:hypothetical protein [Acidobacteriota bacterium]HMZ79639.1 hypothetical protein [Acidobacteriota bacterium]HND18626.1 hypothetical protein [Acidobacteriota bacterium]HNH81178.1 hypothetical protein [Acidobacteriota bacterium]